MRWLWEGALDRDLTGCHLALNAGCDINLTGHGQTTPLYIACFKGHLDIVRLLLENNCNIDQAMDDGRMPLYAACNQEHLDIVRLLLENKCNIDQAMDDDGRTLVYTPLT